MAVCALLETALLLHSSSINGAENNDRPFCRVAVATGSFVRFWSKLSVSQQQRGLVLRLRRSLTFLPWASTQTIFSLSQVLASSHAAVRHASAATAAAEKLLALCADSQRSGAPDDDDDAGAKDTAAVASCTLPFLILLTALCADGHALRARKSRRYIVPYLVPPETQQTLRVLRSPAWAGSGSDPGAPCPSLSFDIPFGGGPQRVLRGSRRQQHRARYADTC